MRIFLYIFSAIVLLLLAGGILFNSYWLEAMRILSTPSEDFDTTSTPVAPDYTISESWIRQDTINQATEVAVFLIHPTSFFRPTAWNAPIDTPESVIMDEQVFNPFLANIFASQGPVWAPRYRQATFGALLLEEENQNQSAALNLAFQDIKLAFGAFLNTLPADMPFIIAGEDQGGLLAARLASSLQEGDKQHLVAVYALGAGIGINTSMGHMACQTQGDIMCLISWTAFIGEQESHWSDSWGKIGTAPYVCHNPLTHMSKGRAAANQNRLSLLPEEKTFAVTELENSVGAACMPDGALQLLPPIPDRIDQLKEPTGRIGPFNAALFASALQDDMARRLQGIVR